MFSYVLREHKTNIKSGSGEQDFASSSKTAKLKQKLSGFSKTYTHKHTFVNEKLGDPSAPILQEKLRGFLSPVS
jgi:hypothetical protein